MPSLDRNCTLKDSKTNILILLKSDSPLWKLVGQSKVQHEVVTDRYLELWLQEITAMDWISSTVGARWEGSIKQGRWSHELREQTQLYPVLWVLHRANAREKGAGRNCSSPPSPEKSAPSLQMRAFHKSANSSLMCNFTLNTTTWGEMHPIRDGSGVLCQQK